MRQGQLLATGLIYTRQKYIVLDETQKFTKTDNQLPIYLDSRASLIALRLQIDTRSLHENKLFFPQY